MKKQKIQADTTFLTVVLTPDMCKYIFGSDLHVDLEWIGILRLVCREWSTVLKPFSPISQKAISLYDQLYSASFQGYITLLNYLEEQHPNQIRFYVEDIAVGAARGNQLAVLEWIHGKFTLPIGTINGALHAYTMEHVHDRTLPTHPIAKFLASIRKNAPGYFTFFTRSPE